LGCRFLVHLMGILSAAENGFTDSCAGASLLQEVLHSVQSTLVGCEEWAKSHRFYHAIFDKVWNGPMCSALR
jgi:hypothetical protein